MFELESTPVIDSVTLFWKDVEDVWDVPLLVASLIWGTVAGPDAPVAPVFPWAPTSPVAPVYPWGPTAPDEP